MKKALEIIVLTLFSGVSTASIAADCSSLMSIGAQASVIPSANGIALADVNSCLAQCTQLPSTGNPVQDAANATQCANSLSVLAYAVTYVNALQAYNPSQFTATPNSSSVSAPTPASAAAPLPETSAPPTYAPLPTQPNTHPTTSNNNANSSNTKSYIRWY